MWLTLSAIACGAIACSDAEHTVGVYDVGLAGMSGARGGSPSNQGGRGGTGAPINDGSVATLDAVIPDATTQCAGSVVPSTRKRLGLYLIIDPNFIARGNENWDTVVQGITAYSRRSEAEGTSLGLRAINPEPLEGIADFPSWILEWCNPPAYTTPTVPIGPEPLPANVDAISGALDNIALSLTTPLLPALEGAIIHASSLKNSFPDETKAVVLLSDAFLDLSCASNAQQLANIAAEGADQGIPSYMVELLVPLPEIWPITYVEPWLNGTLIPLDPVASAGGTEHAYSLDMNTDTASDLSDTLLEIQRHAQGCRYLLPESESWEDVLLAADTGVGQGPFPRLASEAECPNAGGAYLETAGSATWARACPSSCLAIEATGREPVWIVNCDPNQPN